MSEFHCNLTSNEFQKLSACSGTPQILDTRRFGWLDAVSDRIQPAALRSRLIIIGTWRASRITELVAAHCISAELVMIERLLEPGSTELPDCPCGKQMRLEQTQIATNDTEIRIFQCPGCKRELRLTVWSIAD
jgi:hypothetical protein